MFSFSFQRLWLQTSDQFLLLHPTADVKINPRAKRQDVFNKSQRQQCNQSNIYVDRTQNLRKQHVHSIHTDSENIEIEAYLEKDNVSIHQYFRILKLGEVD